MQIKTFKTRIFKERNDLSDFIFAHIKPLKDRSIVVITSKVVALAEGRTVSHLDMDDPAFMKLLEQESEWMMRTKYTWLTVKDGALMASAGIDRSNADGKMVLLPKDSFASAQAIRSKLARRYGVQRLGVLITDSRLLPLRAGVTGIATGYAGFKGVRDYRGKKDIFGRTLQYSRTDVADSLASAAVLEMGEGNEQQPLALITDAPVEFTKGPTRRNELGIDPCEDVYGPFFARKKTVIAIKRSRMY